MSDGLTFHPSQYVAKVHIGCYEVEHVIDEWWALFFPRGPVYQPSEEILDPLGRNWPTQEAAIEACRKHYALRTGGVSMAPAGPVGVDGDGAPV